MENAYIDIRTRGVRIYTSRLSEESMSNGVSRRSQIDTELGKGLLLMHGGGSIALLAFLPTILDNPSYVFLSKAVLWGLLFYQLGLVTAIVHYRLRRKCSLEFERHEFNPPPCNKFPLSLFKFRDDPPCVCRASVLCMWASILLFIVAAVVIFLGGYTVIDKISV